MEHAQATPLSGNRVDVIVGFKEISVALRWRVEKRLNSFCAWYVGFDVNGGLRFDRDLTPHDRSTVGINSHCLSNIGSAKAFYRETGVQTPATGLVRDANDAAIIRALTYRFISGRKRQ